MTSSSISDLHITLAGRFKGGRARLAERVRSLGATAAEHVSSKTNLFVQGSGSVGGKREEAERYNVSIITQEEFLQMLDGVSLDAVLEQHESEVSETVEWNNSLSAFRQALALGPTYQAWDQLVSLLDACSEHELPLVVEYVAEHMSDWDNQPHPTWWISSHGRAQLLEETAPHVWSTRVNDWWINALEYLGSDVRIAPHHWLKEILNGVDSPKWSLLRHIHGYYLKLNGKLGAKLLEATHLNHLTCLDVSENNKLPGKFFKQLRQSEQMRHLKSLRVGDQKENALKALHGDSTFHLERLGMNDNGGLLQGAMDFLLTAECCKDVHTLEFTNVSASERALRCIEENPEVLTKVTSLRQTFLYTEEGLQALGRSRLMGQLTHLSLGGGRMLPEHLGLVLHRDVVPELHTLDLQDMVPVAYPDDYRLQDVQGWALKALENSGLGEQLEEFVPGALLHPALEEWLKDNNVSISEGVTRVS